MRMGSLPSNSLSHAFSSGAFGPEAQNSWNTLARPSCWAISPQKKCGGLLRPLKAATRASPNIWELASPPQYFLRRAGCLASKPKPTSKWVLPPPIACLRWKTAWVETPAIHDRSDDHLKDQALGARSEKKTKPEPKNFDRRERERRLTGSLPARFIS